MPPEVVIGSTEAMSSYLFKSRTAPPQQNPPPPEERQRKINEVRQLLGNLSTEMSGFLTAGTIRRFLRTKNWSTAQATKALKETVKWRRQYQPEKIRWEDIQNEAKRSYLADYRDRNGRIVCIAKPATKRLTSAKDDIKLSVYNLENMALDSEDADEDHVVMLYDYRGWTPSDTPVRESIETMNIIQKHYPGLIAVAIFCNPPKIFESFWKLLKPFLEPKLRDRVKFVHSNNPEGQRIMTDLFDLDKLESAFGGRNTADLDITMYGETMRRRDRIRGACMSADD